MARLVIYSAGLVIASLVMLRSDPAEGWLFAISSGLVIGFFIPLLDTLIIHHRYLKIAWYSLKSWRSRVRISASYLYRIHIDGDYLLVKGHRFDHYQPAGGVYKAHPSSYGTLNEMRVLNDDLLVPDEVSEHDLRVRVPGKHLFAFIRWFESGRGRETDGWREFYEELIATGILSHETFGFIKYDRITRLYHPMRYSPWASSQELLIADIFELIPTPAQHAELRHLKTVRDPRFLWVSENQIRRLGAADGASSQTTRIAETAVWTIDASI
ncbi:HU-CCDC81 and SPOR domain-containing protein [Planctomonas deserti]|uniref:SMODS-associated NUDIX domain-containing protein n=1 Tax=Planctomonas deserti TaxID=2144185 RepID=UPI000D387A57|nr:HU-CCDC81 and SPOR domain-containing protein [Planctomonas deserti]